MRWPVIALLLLLPTLTFAVPSKHVLVVKVTDGDTITVLTGDQKDELIRLWGIDAPENERLTTASLVGCSIPMGVEAGLSGQSHQIESWCAFQHRRKLRANPA